MLNWIVWNVTDYLHKNGFGLNNLQRLICHKTQPTKPNQTWLFNCVYLENVFTNHIFNIHVKTGFGVKWPTMDDTL